MGSTNRPKGLLVQELDDLISCDVRMHRLFEQIRGARESQPHAIVRGESGAGKELVAESLHRNSLRAHRPLLPLNCAMSKAPAFLLGQKRDAYPGAWQQPSFLATARGGTLLLDYIDELPLPAQAQLLRALETGEVRPNNGDPVGPLDVRIVATTQRSIPEAIAQGRFLAKLYERLGILRLEIPPLRQRLDDIPILWDRLWPRDRVGGPLPLDPSAREKLIAHDWPGNVWELVAAVADAATTARPPAVRGEDIRLHQHGLRPDGSGPERPTLH